MEDRRDPLVQEGRRKDAPMSTFSLPRAPWLSMTVKSVIGFRSSGTCRLPHGPSAFGRECAPSPYFILNVRSRRAGSARSCNGKLSGAIFSTGWKVGCVLQEPAGLEPCGYCSKARQRDPRPAGCRIATHGKPPDSAIALLSVPALGLGCMSMSGTYGKHDDAQVERVVYHVDRLRVVVLTVGARHRLHRRPRAGTESELWPSWRFSMGRDSTPSGARFCWRALLQ